MREMDTIQIQLYYGKKVTLRGGHIESEGKRRKLRR
jgi:hypothetical protein